MYGRGMLSMLSESLASGKEETVQYLMNRSSLEVLAVDIRNATKDSFDISIECRVTGTGPISSTISPMEVDLQFNSSSFGRMRLPQINTSPWGTTVLILEQKVHVSKMDVYRAFVRSIISDEVTSFRLDNGHCQIKTFGLSAECKYAMDIPMVGMAGLKAAVEGVSKGGKEESVVVKVRFNNQSPVQIDYGTTMFELITAESQVIARLSGQLQILRGVFTVDLKGRIAEGMKLTGSRRLRLRGTGTKEDSWCNETIQYVDNVVELRRQDQLALGVRDETCFNPTEAADDLGAQKKL